MTRKKTDERGAKVVQWNRGEYVAVTRKGASKMDKYVVAIYDADNKCIAREVKFRERAAAERHAQRKLEEIQRRGWRMTVRVEEI